MQLLKCLLKGSGVKVKEKQLTKDLVLFKRHCYRFQAAPHVQLKLMMWKVLRTLGKFLKEKLYCLRFGLYLISNALELLQRVKSKRSLHPLCNKEIRRKIFWLGIVSQSRRMFSQRKIQSLKWSKCIGSRSEKTS